MAWTKTDIIQQAYSEIGKTSDFDLQPEELQSALRQLDAMLAMWSGTQGIRIGFAGGDGFGDVSAAVEVPLWAVEALYLNLALRIAPSFGKTPMPETKINAKQALDALRVRCVTPATRQISGYAGAGNSHWGATPLPDHLTGIATGPDNVLDLGVSE